MTTASKWDDGPNTRQGPLAPCSDVFERRVGGLRDELGRDLDPVEFFEMAANVSGARPATAWRDHSVVEAVEAALAFLDQLRFESALAVPRNFASLRECFATTSTQPSAESRKPSDSD